MSHKEPEGIALGTEFAFQGFTYRPPGATFSLERQARCKLLASLRVASVSLTGKDSHGCPGSQG